MKKRLLIFLAGFFSLAFTFAQSTLIKGSVKDAATNEPLPEVTITIEETGQQTQTDAKGEFVFSQNVPLGEQMLRLTKNGYAPKRYPIVVNEGSIVDISDMILDIDVTDTVDLFTITLSDDELNNDTSGADNISGLLQSSQDVYQRTAAFEFSSSFFRVRGMDSENGSVLINGIEMNKLYDGRPQWSNWGGLNDVLRNQELTTGLQPSDYNFGGFIGTNNLNVRASRYRQGGRVTYSSSNRSYTNRVIGSYATGELNGGWSMVFAVGRRWGNEGFQDATLYDANSFFTSIEKKLGDKHSINFTSMYAPNRRGKSSPNTQEVYDLRGIKYNEYWGWQDGDKRNSRIKTIEEPIFMLNHYWDITEKTKLNTNIGYQFGKIGNSRLDWNGSRLNDAGVAVGGGSNPSPAYYQKLPSFWLGLDDGPNYENAYLYGQDFINDGQINWTDMYQHNLENVGGHSTYILYEDRTDDSQFTANTILSSEINQNILLNGGLTYKKLKSENFAEVLDLLGGNSYLDVDTFESDPDRQQSDMNNPFRTVGVGDKFRYNYNLHADIISAYAQAKFKYNRVDFYVAGNVGKTNYYREGLYRNGSNAENSFGKSEELDFTGLGAKAGFTFKISGKHLINANAGYQAKAPNLRNTFSNSRVNNNIIPNITEEKITAFDASYVYRSPIINAKLTGYYNKIEDANEVSFYYADGVIGFDDVAEFVSETLQGVDKRYLGAELGIEAQVLPTLKLKGVAALGNFTYDNNPNLILSSNDRDVIVGQSNLKDYKLASGPQTAASLGFEYRDPDYWWFGATVNYFTNTYVDVAPLTRTRNFYLNPVDEIPFDDYDQEVARELLRQEEFEDYFTVNLIGGKSWKIDDYYIGFFASVNNLLDEVYKTGGFEQGRNANYRELLADESRDTPIFGSKYWYGRGATYFVNVYFRF
ncbi:TonB-dependent receptor [Mangrovimonas sp. AS39]|uniref:TonB-dependent receptor n=2 Tax=Pseudomonadati TaxID=3379134 RepID=UPI001E644CF7|nr:TonB-dependent receptor [Mangrovimonas futianensis]MCF1190557.1 TonB-dependent receptor [Mangrovimonas futianensis]MCF1193691.1 TonB-dependent receptor [Mangrovimonas futianensis]MCF1420656.1 TonB-dependent receptor [Mangrovimonas futianensis]